MLLHPLCLNEEGSVLHHAFFWYRPVSRTLLLMEGEREGRGRGEGGEGRGRGEGGEGREAEGGVVKVIFICTYIMYVQYIEYIYT